jgi:hypothetical protein
MLKKKNMKKVILSLLVLATLGTVACKKNEVIPPPTPTSNMAFYFTDNENEAKQNFSVNASTWNSFTGDNGVKINVPANSFVYSNGNIVTGTIDFELIEVLDVSSMVSLNKTTTSNDEILVSGGQIKLIATQNSSQVFLAQGMAVEVKVPTANPDPQMELFVGNQNSTGDVDWVSSVVDTTQQDSIIVVGDTIGSGWVDYYSFDFTNDSLGWINCDYFWNNSSPDTDIIAQLDTAFNSTNTACFLVFTDINSVMGLYNYSAVNNGEFGGINIPTGQPVTFVCISEIDGLYYSAFINSMIVANHIENITMSSTTIAAIQSAIDNL